MLIQTWLRRRPPLPTKPKGGKTSFVRSPANASKRPGKDPEGDVVFYRSPDGMVRLEVQLADTVRLTQQQMAALFQRERSVITETINHVFKDGELTPKSNMQNLHIAGSDKPVRFFNLDIVISVGYRVKFKRDIQFHSWFTSPCSPSTMEAMHAH